MNCSRSRALSLFALVAMASACSDSRPGSDEQDASTGASGGWSSGSGDGDGGDATSGGSEGTEGEDGEGDGDQRFDTPDGESGETGLCGDGSGGGGGESEYDFGVIWIANSSQGTVSKIDTMTATEVARYITGPSTFGPDPSRTSVNLQGDVAIANRFGSITKIALLEENCVDLNGDGQIQTSQGANDILPWGQDECVLWNHQTGFSGVLYDSNTGGPRAVAWDAGLPGEDPCGGNPRVWASWRNQPDNSITIRRLDGATGEVDAEVVVPNWVGNWEHGAYGGATDINGDFWVLGTLGTLIKVDTDTLDVSRYDMDTPDVVYGMALDADGTPWVAGFDGRLWRFDPGLESWDDMGPMGTPTKLRGLAIDASGTAWAAGNEPCALVRYDTVAETTIEGSIPLVGCVEPVGVSIDVEGAVWVVDRGANVAYKVSPDDYSVQIVYGLVDPYTYSDMTGAALNLVVNPPTG